MCGRYWIDPSPDTELAEIIAQMQHTELPVKSAGEIFPGDHAPVICRSRSGALRPFAMEWGFRLEDGRRVINARSESAAEKPLFKDSLRDRRCLIPMSAYFEWEVRGKEKLRHRIQSESKDLCCLAGLYRFEADGPVFTVLTREAVPELTFIHERMPLIFEYEAGKRWLLGHASLKDGITALRHEEAPDRPMQLRLDL